MDFRSHLLALGSAYSDARGISLARTSTLVMNHGAFLKEVGEGRSCQIDTYTRCMAWFSDHWPEGLDWPADVPRPAPAKPPEQGASVEGRAA